MGCVITVHHPNLSEEEREHRVDQIKKRIIEYMKEVFDERKALEESEEKK